ncbi:MULTISPECIES: HPr family phosphocarrier protein [unclassified Paenibacillus]|uniref:HPr family phosphocarrier protein n=1 Tax=unclassified Paenibacillus TaxID=185978 RepID=UPI001E3DD00A|nr:MULTISPECIES: HPr family phosphocarrier protein [unclassified Paenibacillus]CAH0118423.1 Phosphocarrier protein HPr [Paenibacillus sp. CECT 9249]
MQQRYIINNPTGIHARPAGAIIKKAETFPCRIELETEDGTRISAKSLIGILKLGLKQGDRVAVIAEGEDEAEAVRQIGEIVQSIFE